jgi:hypothetical protein
MNAMATVDNRCHRSISALLHTKQHPQKEDFLVLLPRRVHIAIADAIKYC